MPSDDRSRPPAIPKRYQNPSQGQGEVTTERGPGGAEVKVTTVNGRRVKFIDSYWTFGLATLFIGPLALPLFWRNPRASRQAKVAVTLVMAALTAGLVWVNVKAGKWVKANYDQYKELQRSLQQGEQ